MKFYLLVVLLVTFGSFYYAAANTACGKSLETDMKYICGRGKTEILTLMMKVANFSLF